MPRLIGFASVQQELWSEVWVDRSAMLSAMADWLRRQPTTARMAFDEGWWDNRDLTLEHGLVRFDLQALVEDHGRGRCLCRLRVRSRCRVAAMAILATLAGSLFLTGADSVTWSLGALAALVLVTHDVMIAWRLLSGACSAVAADFGLSTLGTGSRVADGRTATGSC